MPMPARCVFFNLNWLYRMKIKLANPLFTVCLFWAMLLSVPGHTATQAKVEMVMDVAGINKQSELMAMSIHQQIQQQIAQSIAQSPPQNRDMLEEVAEIILSTAQEVFTAEALMNEFRQILLADFNDQEVEKILSFYRSSLGKRATQYELEASKPANQQALIQYIQKLQQQAPRAIRTQLAKRLDESMAATESQVDQTLAASASTAHSITNAMMCGEGPSLEEIQQGVAAQRPALLQQTSALTQGSILYTYRYFKDSELEALIQKMESPEFSKLNHLAIKAMDSMYETFNERMMDKMNHSELMKSIQSQCQ